MTANCFVRQEASIEIITNVTSFCSACYTNIIENEIIFYDMKNCCYLCAACQQVLSENLDINCEPISSDGNSLF